MRHAALIRYAHSFLISFMWSVLLSSSAFGEMYAAGMAGYTAPDDLTDVKGTALASAFSVSDLALQSSVAYGGKLGYFFPAVNWLGVETEVYNTTPHVKQQPATISGFGMSLPGTLTGFHLRVLTWGMNAVARYPGKTFQPYAGVGLGLFFAHATFRGQSDDDTAAGLNVLAGLRLFLTDHVALFGEYKYNRAAFSFTNAIGLQADYSASIFMGGLSYHF
jgi:opacity protein-like surface antigen